MYAHYFRNRRIFSVLLLGFSSGLPLALTGSTLQAWFTQENVSILTIGILSLTGLPYALKFLWAPILDRFVPPWLGRRRGWVMMTQIALSVMLFCLTLFSPEQQPKLMGVIALIIAFLSASQDIAFDAYRTDLLLPEERGLGAAALTLGYRMALLISGGVALILADRVGWRVTYQCMSIIMILMAAVTWYAPENQNPVAYPKTFLAAMIEPLKNLLARDQIGFILLFVILYKIGDALALSLMSNFLLRELGFSLTEIGVTFKTMGLLATIVGALLGGILLVRIPVFKALLWFGLLQAISNMMFMLLAIVGKNISLMVSSIFIEQFCSGMSTAALIAFLMSLCDARYTATQYALLSALASLGRVFLGPVAALMVAHMGWVNFYGWTTALCFPGLALIFVLRHRVGSHAKAISSF